tara:strand:- start:1537 stop:1761 length:225 start_codon:yes stop_codon:yes gene_type:complete
MAVKTPLPEKRARTKMSGLLGARLPGTALFGSPVFDRNWVAKTTRTRMQPVVMARLGIIELFVALNDVGCIDQQ